MNKVLIAFFLAVFTFSAMYCRPATADGLSRKDPKVEVANKVPLRAWAFDLRDVRLLDGPFKHAQELDRRVPALVGHRPLAPYLPNQCGAAFVGQAAGWLGGAEMRTARATLSAITSRPAR